jgi:hypothetical protein
MWKGITRTIRGKQIPTIIKNPELVNSQISIFPNPFNSEISIVGINSPFKAVITDLNGKDQIIDKICMNKLNVSALQKGFYLLKISTRQESKIFKIIKM